MNILVCDLEGTITDNKHRLPHAQAKDWDTFNAKFEDDTLRVETLSLIKTVQESGWKVFISTGMSIKSEEVALNWLEDNRVTFDALLMRESDCCSSPEVKQAHLKQIAVFGHVALAIDDRQKNVDMYELHGIPTIYLPGSDY